MATHRGIWAVVPVVVLLASCTATDRADPAPEATTSVSATPTEEVTTPTPPQTPAASPQWPQALSERDAWYGATQPTWAVYIAESKTADDHTDLTTRLTTLGYPVIWTPLGFHTSSTALYGDTSNLGSTDRPWTLNLYFTDEAAATAFVTLWDSPVIGVASGSPAADFD
ncbi:MAG: hypothetical protein KJ792_12070 [Actinobacteria bacterium]|nr:hypothetical protein [Actinomycetota bacterium]MCG2802046.1 hypothetical protein [Cellulomonas sp.]